MKLKLGAKERATLRKMIRLEYADTPKEAIRIAIIEYEHRINEREALLAGGC